MIYWEQSEHIIKNVFAHTQLLHLLLRVSLEWICNLEVRFKLQTYNPGPHFTTRSYFSFYLYFHSDKCWYYNGVFDQWHANHTYGSGTHAEEILPSYQLVNTSFQACWTVFTAWEGGNYSSQVMQNDLHDFPCCTYHVHNINQTQHFSYKQWESVNPQIVMLQICMSHSCHMALKITVWFPSWRMLTPTLIEAIVSSTNMKIVEVTRSQHLRFRCQLFYFLFPFVYLLQF